MAKKVDEINKLKDLVILEEIESIIPKLTSDEYKQLETNIQTDGCREPLVVFNYEGKETLLDGHNRYEICRKHNIPYECQTNENIHSLSDAKIFVIKNQFGRRNLTVKQRAKLALQLDVLIKPLAKEQLKKGGKIHGKGKLENKVHTNKELARIADISEKTIQRVKKIKKEGTPEQKERLESGASINEVYNEVTGKPKQHAPLKTLFTPEQKKEIVRIMFAAKKREQVSTQGEALLLICRAYEASNLEVVESF